MASNQSPSRSWLADLFSGVFLWLCAGFTLVSVCTPPEGIPGVDLCPFRRLTGVPCPGCGMTRSGANLVRGDVGRAFRYHPFGVAVIPICAGLGSMVLAPRSWRERAQRAVARWKIILQPLFWLCVAAFLSFGLVRCVLVLSGSLAFP